MSAPNLRHWGSLFTIALAAACSNKPAGDKPAPTTTPSATAVVVPSAVASAAPSAVAAPALATAEFKIGATGMTMVYDVSKFYVKPGQPVHVVFENKAPGTLAHNWVLLAKAGTEASFAASVVDKTKDDFYADGPAVLAHVPLTKPGTTSETTFTAPTVPGDYPYICSFPGHYVMMKGVLTVKP
ncbi:MAG TPA: plastocyanin/azurin family copper-binding protein [Polyangiaceae bacterium]